MQVLFFYPFSGFITKFAPPLQRIAAASVHRVPPTHLQKIAKISRTPQPGTSAEAFGGSPFGPSAGTSAGVVGGVSVRSLLESFLGASAGTFRRAFGAPLEELLGSLCGHLCGRNKKPVLEGRVPHTNINNTNNAMAEFSAFCFRYKGRTKRIMGQSPQLSIFVRVNSPDLGSKPPRYR